MTANSAPTYFDITTDPVVAVPKLEQVSEPEPVTEVVSETKLEPVTEVVSEPVTEVVSETKLEPVTEVVSEPVTEVVPEPVTEVVSETKLEPVTEVVSEPVTEVVPEPVTEVVSETKIEPVTEVVSEPVSEPVPEEDIQDVLDRVNQEFLELSREADLATISNYIDANHIHIWFNYKDFSVMRRFIERRDLDLCKLVHTKLGPVRASSLQTWIKQNARTTALDFLLDLADALGIKPIASWVDYHTILYKACSADTGLELADRVYRLWSTANPFQAFGGSCISRNRDKIDYFLDLCVQYNKPSDEQQATALMCAVASGSLYAFRALISNINIDWLSTLRIPAKGMDAHTRNTLNIIIKNCATEKTGTLIKEFVEYLSKQTPEFTRENIDTNAFSGFWNHYAIIIKMVCKHGHADAVRFFLKVAKVSFREIKLFIEEASSEEVIRAIFETAAPILTLESASDLAMSIEVPAARKHIAAYYQFLANQLTAPQ